MVVVMHTLLYTEPGARQFADLSMLRLGMDQIVQRVASRYMGIFTAGMPHEAWGLHSPTLPRETHKPKDAVNFKTENPPGTDLEVWTWESPQYRTGVMGFDLVIFMGRAQKPLVGPYWYKTEQQRQHMINESIDRAKHRVNTKLQKSEERKNFKHGLQEGDILYASWGYDQTNIDFYQVTKVIGKAVEVREIGKRVVSSGHGSDKVMAEPNEFIGPPMKKIPQGQGAHIYVKISDVQTAHEWEGNPLHQTASGYGH